MPKLFHEFRNTASRSATENTVVAWILPVNSARVHFSLLVDIRQSGRACWVDLNTVQSDCDRSGWRAGRFNPIPIHRGGLEVNSVLSETIATDWQRIQTFRDPWRWIEKEFDLF